MEESEKRRERLKAIRMGAAQAEVSANVETSSIPVFLSNPLIETSGTPSVQNEFGAAPRFDFYTDPMAAFSGNRRSKLPQDQFTSSRIRSPQLNPSPTHQLQTNFSPNQAVHRAQGPRHTSTAHMTPPQVDNLYPMHPPGVWSSSAGMTSPNFPPTSAMSGNIRSCEFGRVSSPGFSSAQARGLMSNSPNTGSGWEGSPNSFRGSHRPSLGRGSPNPYIGRGCPSPHQGRGSPSPHQGRGAPSPYPGRGSPNPYLGRGGPSPNLGTRGRGHWFGNSSSPSLGRDGQRGRGPHAHATAEDKPELFYHKSMMEDPWKDLTPVIWRSHTQDSWLPKSISMKKARVSEAHSESSLQQSLAEYLAASFSEAVNDSSDV